MDFIGYIVRRLSGVDSYSSVQHWLTKCVLVRILIALVAAGLTFALLRFQLGFGTVAREAMVYLMILTNGFLTLFLTFGAGRNYERSRIAWETCATRDCG